jgi:hypothetical protein
MKNHHCCPQIIGSHITDQGTIPFNPKQLKISLSAVSLSIKSGEQIAFENKHDLREILNVEN